jgi:hypothetical protein
VAGAVAANSALKGDPITMQRDTEVANKAAVAGFVPARNARALIGENYKSTFLRKQKKRKLKKTKKN